MGPSPANVLAFKIIIGPSCGLGSQTSRDLWGDYRPYNLLLVYYLGYLPGHWSLRWAAPPGWRRQGQEGVR